MTFLINAFKAEPHQTLSNLKALQYIRIYICIADNTAETEKSFSCFKRLKACLRKIMGQERLSHLGILSKEHSKIVFHNVLHCFASSNCCLLLEKKLILSSRY
jgi:hypothetical protein